MFLLNIVPRVKKLFRGDEIMNKTLHKNKQTKRNYKKLLDEVAKFRKANQKFLLPNLGNQESVMHYKIIQSDHTSDIDSQIYG